MSERIEQDVVPTSAALRAEQRQHLDEIQEIQRKVRAIPEIKR